MPLFFVAIVESPTDKEKEEGAEETLIFYTDKPIVANDAESAKVTAVIKAGETIKVSPSRIDVQVRPF